MVVGLCRTSLSAIGGMEDRWFEKGDFVKFVGTPSAMKTILAVAPVSVDAIASVDVVSIVEGPDPWGLLVF